MKLEFSAATVTLIVFLVTHLCTTIWVASRVVTMMDVVQKELSELKEYLMKVLTPKWENLEKRLGRLETRCKLFHNRTHDTTDDNTATN